MSGQDAPFYEMPKFARQARLDREHEELALDMLLDGLPLPPEAPSEMTALPLMLADLSGPAGPSELAGEAAALSRFRRHHSPAGISSRRRPERRMPSRQSPARRAQLAAALTVAAIGLGGTAAAYAGVLPSPVQKLAAHVIGAPEPGPAAQHPGRITRAASHRPASPPEGRGRAEGYGPSGQHNHATGPGHPPQAWQWGLRDPSRAHWPGHGIPPGQLGNPHPAHLVPPGHATPPGERANPGHHRSQPSQPAQGRPFMAHRLALAGHASRPGRGTSPGHAARPGRPAPHGHSPGHGRTARGKPGRMRLRAR